MFCGKSIYVFKGGLTNNVPFRFSTLVCFDWIATSAALTPCDTLLNNIHENAVDGQLPLTWLFVVQHNPQPSHHAFLIRVREFLNLTKFPNALRNGASLIFANTAGKKSPGRTQHFGGCSIIHSPQSLFQSECSLPTYSNGGPRFRDGSNLLSGGYKVDRAVSAFATEFSFSEMDSKSQLDDCS